MRNGSTRRTAGFAAAIVIGAFTAVAAIPSSATAAPVPVACSGGGSFDFDASTGVVSQGNTCVGTADIPSGATSIGGSAFFNVPSLVSVNIPSSVTTLGFRAFAGAASLASVNFAANSQLTTMVGRVFQNTALTTITLPGSLTSLGWYDFADIPTLKSVDFAGNAPSILVQPGSTFDGSPNVTVYRFSSATGFGSGPTWELRPLAYWLPQAPTPTATAGPASATVSVGAPTLGPPATSFTITAVGDATKSCTVTGASGSCTVSGLTVGTSYTFTAVYTDGFVTSPVSAVSNAVTPTAASTPASTSAPSPAPTPVTPKRSKLPARTTCLQRTCTTTGSVPAGATRVVQRATSAGRRAVGRCTIKATGTTKTYRCSISLGTGSWRLVTAARAGSRNVALARTRVGVRVMPRPVVTG